MEQAFNIPSSLNYLARGKSSSRAESFSTGQGRPGSLGSFFSLCTRHLFLCFFLLAWTLGGGIPGSPLPRTQELPRQASVPKILRCFVVSDQCNLMGWVQGADDHPCCCSHAAEASIPCPGEGLKGMLKHEYPCPDLSLSLSLFIPRESNPNQANGMTAAVSKSSTALFSQG